MTRVGFLGPHGTFAEEALLTQPDLAAGEAVPFRDVPHVITAVEQRRGRPRPRAHRELDRGLDHRHPRHPGVRHRAPRAAGGRPAGVAAPLRAEGHEAGRHHHRGVAPQPARPDPDVDGEAPPRRDRGGRQLHRRGGPAGGEVAQARHGVDRHRARARPTPACRSSPARSRTTRRTRPASCSSATASPRPPATTRPRSCASSARTVPARCSRSCRSSRRGRSTSPSSSRAPPKREPRRLLLLHRLRGSPRRRGRRRLPAQPRGQAGQGEVPRLVPGVGRRRPRAPQGRHQGASATPTRGWAACASRSADEGTA